MVPKSVLLAKRDTVLLIYLHNACRIYFVMIGGCQYIAFPSFNSFSHTILHK